MKMKVSLTVYNGSEKPVFGRTILCDLDRWNYYVNYLLEFGKNRYSKIGRIEVKSYVKKTT